MVPKENEEIVHVDDTPLLKTYPVATTGDARNPLVLRSRVGQWLAIRAVKPDITVKDAAEMLGINPRTLTRNIKAAVGEGWLKFDDPLERIEYEIVPKTIDNLSRLLDEGDRTVTIEAAKGTIFQAYKASKEAVHSSQPILALKIELMPGSDANVKIGGNVFGTPKEVIDTYAIPVRETAEVSLGEAPRDSQKMDQEVRIEASRWIEKGSSKEEEGLD